MSKITKTDVHVDAALTNLAIGYHPAGMVAERIAKPIMVNKESDKYYIWDRQSAFQVGSAADGTMSLRADKTESRLIDFGLSTSTYTAEEYALKILVSDREVKNADSVLRLRDGKRRRLQDILMLEQEMRLAALLTTAANWDANHTSDPGNWSTGSPTIEKNVDDAKEVVRKAIGVEPNTIVIPSAVAKAVKRDSTVRDLIKYTHADLLVNGDLPPRLWNMDVIIPGASYTSSVEGASSVTYSDVWGDDVVLLYVESDPVIDSPTAVKIFRSENWSVNTWRENKLKSEAIEISVIQDEVLTSNISGYLYKDVLAS